MRQLSTIAIIALSFCLGCDEQIGLSVPLNVADGAYGGVVTVETVSVLGEESANAVTTGYRIIEIVEGRIVAVLNGFNVNSTFICTYVQPGAENTVSFETNEGALDLTTTITNVSDASYDGIAEGTLTLGTTSIQVSGSVSLNLNEASENIAYEAIQEIDGETGDGLLTLTTTTIGTLFRIGNNGSLPAPDGMNGYWQIDYPESEGRELILIDNLRVLQYFDAFEPEGKAVTEASVVSGSEHNAASVRFSFTAETAFDSDPTLRNWEITFQGSNNSDDFIVGTMTFEAPDQETKVLDAILGRFPSEPCDF